MSDREQTNKFPPGESGSAAIEPALSPADQRIVDALMESGFDSAAMEMPAQADQKRAAAVSNLLGLMRDYPVEDCEPALIDATLARIDRYEDQQAARLNFDVQQDQPKGLFGGRGRRIR